MKLLIGLSVLQTAAIIALIAIVLNGRSVQVQVPGMNTPHREVHAVDGIPAPTFDEQRLRKLIREELAAHQSNSTGSAKTGPAKTEAVVDVRSAARLIEQREHVGQIIESYKGVGSITDQQMQELQDEIAQLDEQSRKQMMSSLIRALNTGALKGRLQ